MLKERWPKYEVGLKDGTLVVRFSSTDPDSIVREAHRLREMGLVEGRHISVKMTEGGMGYVSFLGRALGPPIGSPSKALTKDKGWRRCL